MQGQAQDQAYKDQDKDLTHKDQDKDLNLVLKDKDFTYSYLLQVAALQSLSSNNNEQKVKVHNI